MTVAKVAIIQRPPSYLHRDDAAPRCGSFGHRRGSRRGRQFGALFPRVHTSISAWIWRLLTRYRLLRCHQCAPSRPVCRCNAAKSLKRGDLSPLTEAARDMLVTVICGVDERDDDSGGGTLYNTVLVVVDGAVLNSARKSCEQIRERMVWSFRRRFRAQGVIHTPAGTNRNIDLLGKLHAACGGTRTQTTGD